ncbi:MAG: (2Fe-2S)-binding protein [Nitrososphaerales archaeon]|nr:(2Fe-2S)-binding protein [Nitrososphaerales archaeon]
MNVNGAEHSFHVDSTDRLIDVLRERMGLKSVKEGCGTGDCGICAVLVEGKLVNSCLMLAAQCDGRRVVTLEGLLDDPVMKRFQGSFVANNAAQCGFCTPAMLLAAWDLAKHSSNPSTGEIKTAISGILCRCTGYYPILDSIREGCRKEARP